MTTDDTVATGGRFVLRDDVVWQESDGTVVVLDTRSSRYLSIGGSGPVLWPLLVAGTTAEDLARALAETYSLEAADARRDVGAFVRELRAHDLLEV